MVSSDRKLANAVGAKSARACDNCVRKRARWYCAADDAFLCQSCDSSVHSANPLARRHERVRVKTASLSPPSWHQGFTRKPRTPRQKKYLSNSPLLVPEISGEENSHEENEEQLLYRVPIFDPFVAQLCNSGNSSEAQNSIQHDEFKPLSGFSHETSHGFFSSETDLDEFAADVETLLGKGFEDESFDMEVLGILDCDDGNEKSQRLKIEVGGDVNNQVDDEFLGFGKEANFELNFDYDSPITVEENDVKVEMVGNFGDSNKDKKMFLKLDYEGVISAWDDHKSPWTTGERPVLDSDDCWFDCMGTSGTTHAYGGETGMVYGHAAAISDGQREARVSRYREKRRTRLFSKKIRYEVRKLNAEKRPRMKGRFVKRANCAAPVFAFA